MDFDVNSLSAVEAYAITNVIKTLNCPSPHSFCPLCPANKFCKFLKELADKCDGIFEQNKGV